MPRLTLSLTLTGKSLTRRAAAVFLLALGALACQPLGAAESWRAPGDGEETTSDSPSATRLKWQPNRPEPNQIKSRKLDDDEQLAGDRPARRHRARPASAELNAPGEAIADPFGDAPAPKHPFDESDQAPPAPQSDADTLPAPRETPPALQIEPMPARSEPAELQPRDSTAPWSPTRSQPRGVQSRRQIDEPLPIQSEPIELAPSRRAERDPEEACKTAYDEIKGNTIDKLSVDIRVTGEAGSDYPFECTLGDEQFEPRCWQLTTYTWKSSSLCHKPLYFEDYKLERYGHSHGPVCEYFASAAHFFGDVVLLPYHIGIETPCECIYDLGYYRPGNCAPYMCDPFPFSLRGAATAAAGYVGVIYLFP